MRKTKCKECNGVGCHDCIAGEISVYTIQELREGKVTVKNDGEFIDLKALFVYVGIDVRSLFGSSEYYVISPGYKYHGSNDKPHIPAQSVKIFLEEIEQEEKASTTYSNELINHISARNKEIINALKDNKVEEPEFKWGEEVEFSSLGTDFDHGVYIGLNPYDKTEHVVAYKFDNLNYVYVFKFVRKPEQIEISDL